MYTGFILVGSYKQLAISSVSYVLVCSLYAAAVQSKTYKGALVMIFFICRDLLNCLWNTCGYNIIFI